MAHKDILWKGLLEWVFEDLLRFLFADADQIFDFRKGFTYLDKELSELYPNADGEHSVRFVDKLVKVYRRDGEEEWVLIHLEVQGETKAEDRPHFGKRMFRYFYRIFDNYEKPLAAVAIFTGPDSGKLPGSFDYSFLNTRLHYGYSTLNIRGFTDEELLASDNPFALVILIARQGLLRGKDLDKRLLEGKLFIFRRLYEKGLMEKRKLQAILAFLDGYVQFENQETCRIFRERVDQYTGKANIMDIFEQIAQIRLEDAREEAREMVARNLLTIGKLSAKEIADATGLSISDVKNIGKKLVRK